MDYAATTPVDPEVIEAMKPYFFKIFGNTMSLHFFGQQAKRALEDSREKIANLMNAETDEIIFTGSATEANNLVLKGIAAANKDKGKHIITTSIEHPCIMETGKWLRQQGFDVTFLPVDRYGLVNLADVENAIRKDTILVSVIHANNEIGTIQDISEIGRICKERGVYFHTDAAQSFGKIEIDVNKMNIGLLTASSQKMYGPKGIASLFIRDGIKIEPLLHGGGHEFGLRSSTVNVAGAVGFATAVEIAKKKMKQEAKGLTKLRDRLIKSVLKIENSRLNGHPVKRLPNNANFLFDFIEGESLVMQLDYHGIAASTGSACSSEKLEPSHVLLAIGLKPHEVHGSLRLTLGRWTKKEDIDYVLKILPKVISSLREISPFKGRWS
jgi:cysteine desulfurase